MPVIAFAELVPAVIELIYIGPRLPYMPEVLTGPGFGSGHVSGIFGIFRGDSLSLSEFGAVTFEDELLSQLQFFRHGARHQDLGTSPNLGRTAPMCAPQQQRSAAGA